MLEDGQIDRDTALIQYTPPDFTTKFWQLISDDIERDLLKRNRGVAAGPELPVPVRARVEAARRAPPRREPD